MKILVLIWLFAFSNMVSATVTWSWESFGSENSEQGIFITSEGVSGDIQGSTDYELLDFKGLKSAINPHLEGASISGGQFETFGNVFEETDDTPNPQPTGETKTGIKFILKFGADFLEPILFPDFSSLPEGFIFQNEVDTANWHFKEKNKETIPFTLSSQPDGSNHIFARNGSQRFSDFLIISKVPVPGAFWLLATGLLGIMAKNKLKQTRS